MTNKLEETKDPAVSVMDDIIKNTPNRPEIESLIDGRVIAKGKMALFVDLPPYGTGMIFGREYFNARDLIKKINIGDTVTAKVVTPEGEDGYIELSLKEAKQAILWDKVEQSMKQKEVFSLTVKDVNKGGLIISWEGIDGFLPASQLKPENYPRVPDGDKDKIIEELEKMKGSTVDVIIIGAEPKEGKLIFSEKNLDSQSRKAIVDSFSVGDIIEGEVTGAVDFGIFIKIEEGLEGLVHISELNWSLVEDPRELYKAGDKIKAKIIEIKDDKISLSIKALKPNPWDEVEGKFKKGDIVSGVVIKYNKHGALVSIEEGVAGLVHISDFADENDIRSKLELGKTYDFTINLFEPKHQRMTLMLGDRRQEIEESEKNKADKDKKSN